MIYLYSIVWGIIIFIFCPLLILDPDFDESNQMKLKDFLKREEEQSKEMYKPKIVLLFLCGGIFAYSFFIFPVIIAVFIIYYLRIKL